MQSIFREYDIRGIFERELNRDTTRAIGYLLAQRVRDRGGKYLAIGRDARTHSKQLFVWLSEGVAFGGIIVLNMGMIPTPVSYFANFQKFEGIKPEPIMPHGSIMITGSHNPPEYNGFKITLFGEPFFGEDIQQLGMEVAHIVNANILTTLEPEIYPLPALERYVEYLSDEFSGLSGLKIPLSFDCGNGVANLALSPILERLGIDAQILYGEPDGTFPNHHPDPSNPCNLKDIQALLQKRGGIGFAFDGDADRIAVLSQKYALKGDELAVIFAKNMQNPLVIGEVKCSMSMYDEINKIGRAIMYKTGHSNLKVKLKELSAHLAAEVSGHLFFNDRYFGYDDAIYAALRVLELVKNGVDLDKEKESLPRLYSTEELKIETNEEQKFPLIEKIKELLEGDSHGLPKIIDIITLDGVRIIFERGWGLVRASNTTPVLVTRFEALDEESLRLYQESLGKLIETAKNSLK